MKIKLYIDEDAQNEALLAALRRHQIDVLSTGEANNTGVSDIEQIEFAETVKRIIYTFNVGDFAALHAEYLKREKAHSGIIIGEQRRYGIGGQVRCLLRIIETKSAEEMRNNIEFLNNWK